MWRKSGKVTRMTVEQISLFDAEMPLRIDDKPIRLIELFAGIGSQYMALKRLGLNVTSWRCVEIDKYAVKSFNAIHGTDYVPTDICKLHGADLGITETDKYNYVMSYSFPCQDISNAGLGKGFSKGSGTRSGLLWEVERLLKECNELPNVLLMENVPAVHGKKNADDFQQWIAFLESIGYHSKWQDLNAKNYGIPQNRNRCFMVSWLEDRTDYTFPSATPLEIRLKDVLQDDADEKYYLADNVLQKMLEQQENPT